MPRKGKDTMDIRQILIRLRKGESCRSVARALSMNRKTVGRYRSWAAEQGLMEGTLPCLGDLQQLLEQTLKGGSPPQNISSVEPYRRLVVKLRKQGVEIAAIHERLKPLGAYHARGDSTSGDSPRRRGAIGLRLCRPDDRSGHG